MALGLWDCVLVRLLVSARARVLKLVLVCALCLQRLTCSSRPTATMRGARPVCDGPFATARSPILVASPRSARWCQDLGRGICHVFTL